jgi:hypothetical protein
VACARRWASWGRNQFTIGPDEPAQLAVARFIGGGTRFNMDDHAVWQPFFGTLLSPVYWFTDDPVTVFQAALNLNALLGGITAALIVYLVRRLTPTPPAWGAVISILISLPPAMLFTSAFVFSESLVAPLLLATLLALLAFDERPTLGRGLGPALLAGAAFGSHSRMLPLALITLGAVVLAVHTRRMAVRDGIAIAAVTMASVYLVSIYTAYLVDRLWDEPINRNSIGGVAEQFSSGVPILVSFMGQIWYLLVASLGVIVYGSVILGQAALRTDRQAARARNDARLVLIVVGACGALSVLFMAARWRSDHLVYGRYNDPVVIPILVVGLAALIGAVPFRRLAATALGTACVTVALGGAMWHLRSDALSQSSGLAPMILGLQPLTTSTTSIEVIRISAWAGMLTLFLAAVSLAARNWRQAVVVTAAVFMLGALGATRTDRILSRSEAPPDEVNALETLNDRVPRHVRVVDLYLPANLESSTTRMMLYQFYLPRTEVNFVRDPITGATSPYVFARVTGDGLADSGATLIWRDPNTRYGLWQR